MYLAQSNRLRVLFCLFLLEMWKSLGPCGFIFVNQSTYQTKQSQWSMMQVHMCGIICLLFNDGQTHWQDQEKHSTSPNLPLCFEPQKGNMYVEKHQSWLTKPVLPLYFKFTATCIGTFFFSKISNPATNISPEPDFISLYMKNRKRGNKWCFSLKQREGEIAHLVTLLLGSNETYWIIISLISGKQPNTNQKLTEMWGQLGYIKNQHPYADITTTKHLFFIEGGVDIKKILYRLVGQRHR